MDAESIPSQIRSIGLSLTPFFGSDGGVGDGSDLN